MSEELQRRAADVDADQLLDEVSFEMSEVVGLSQGQIVRRRFFRHRGAMLSLAILTFIVVLAATSVGWGPIPGLVEVRLQRARSSGPRRRLADALVAADVARRRRHHAR